MYFWRDEYFQTLKDVAAEARTVPAWADYAAFCEEYERGLRPEAFNILERFTSSMERALSQSGGALSVGYHSERIVGKGGTCLFRITFTFALSNRPSYSGRRLNPTVLNRICGSEVTTT